MRGDWKEQGRFNPHLHFPCERNLAPEDCRAMTFRNGLSGLLGDEKEMLFGQLIKMPSAAENTPGVYPL
jgi:hypothetical protein